MNKVTSWLKAGLLFGGILFCAKAFIFLDRLDKTVFAVRADVAQVADDIHGAAGKLGATLDDSNKLLAATTETVKLAGGTVTAARQTIDAARPKVLIALDDSHHLLLEAGLTVEEARKASVEQRAYWAKTSQDTDALVKNLNTFVDSANKTTLQLNGAIADADKVISNPAIPSTIGHADKILADGQKVADRLAAPVNTAKRIASMAWNSLMHYLGAK